MRILPPLTDEEVKSMLRVMLAGTVELDKLRYPLLASRKIDGVRAHHQLGRLWSRSLLPFPNVHVNALFTSPLLAGFDGELVVGAPNDPNVMQKTTSVVGSEDSTESVVFYVFDVMGMGMTPYRERFTDLKQRLAALPEPLRSSIVIVEQTYLNDATDFVRFEQECIDEGYEGIIVRDPGAFYKHNRASMVGQHLLKHKRFTDDEAVIIGFEEQMRNENEATKDLRGLTKRSSHKANKVPTGRLGKFVVRDLKTGIEFSLSGKITAKQRQQWWEQRDTLLGKIVVYKHFAVTGVKVKPRQPIFKAFRDPIDMDRDVLKS